MTDVFYSTSPFGTADISVSCNIVVDASGNATFSEAQTGNIGEGCCVEYNSIVSYISEMTDSTHAKLTTAIGAAAASQTSTSVTSIHHVWASLSASEAAYMGASFLNSTDFETDTLSPFLCCYYDHDDQTADSTTTIFDTATANTTYFPKIYTPQGGTESINDQRHAAKLDTNKYYIDVTADAAIIACQIAYMEVDGIQARNNSTGSGSASLITTEAEDANIKVANSIMIGGRYAIYAKADNSGIHLINNIIYGAGTGGYVDNNTGTINKLEYCTIYDCGTYGIRRIKGTTTVTNCIVFGNGDDINGSVTSSYTFTEDGDSGTGNGTLNNSSYAYSNIWTDYSATPPDFSLVNNTTDSNAPQNKGTPISGITTDIIGNTRDSTNPDCGAFEFVASGPSGAILKRYVGAAWVAIDLKDYDVDWSNFVLKKYISGSWQTIDSDGA